MSTSPSITHHPDRSRYEATLDGELAGVCDYRREGDVVTFHHTAVEPRFEGRGVGSALVAGAMADVVAEGGLTVRPTCWFVAEWLDRHPEVATTVSGRGE